MILDLGCGTAKVVGAIGVDNIALPGVDVVHDLLMFPYPFPDASAEEIYLNHVIEHFELSDSQDILREVYRLLCPNGIVHVRVPHVFTIAAWADPTHRSAFTFVSGEFFDSRSPKSYYRELEASWQLARTSARVTWFNWKHYRLRQIDDGVSRVLTWLLDQLLTWRNWPGVADLLVKLVPCFFVEIRWDLKKVVSESL